MKKVYAAIIILIILNVIVGAWYISNHFQPAKKESLNLVEVAEWNGPKGDTNTTTQPFTVTSETWQIIWSWYYTNETGELSHFEMHVFDAKTNNEIQTINTEDQTPFGSISLNGAGTYYMKIFVLGTVANWKVSVEEYK